MDWEKVITLFVVLIISLTTHEAAHGLFAWLGGDSTAKDAGLVTLNPLPHMQREPIGMVLIPMVVLYMSGGKYCFGGASAPIDPYWAARHPKKAALMSAAGPLANVVLAAIAFAVLYFIGRPEGGSNGTGNDMAIGKIAFTFLFLNMLLATFNLIPLPPFDGSGVVRGLAPKTGRLFDAYQKIPVYFILSMIVASFLVSSILGTMLWEVSSWLPWPYWEM